MRVGLINSKGHNVPFDKLAETYDSDNWVIDPALTGGTIAHWPLPVLLAFIKRPSPSGTIWVTSLTQSPRREILKRRHPFYDKPERLLDMTDGSAFHSWIEANSPPEHAEQRLEVEVWLKGNLSATIVGRPDYADSCVYEYKRMKTYGLRKCLENGVGEERPDYALQLRFYAVLLALSGKPVTPPFRLFIWCSDWQKQWGRKRDKPPDPRLGEFLIMPEPGDEDLLKAKAFTYRTFEGLEEDKMPACEDRGAFGELKAGVPRRCTDYCEVNRFCSWWQENKP